MDHLRAVVPEGWRQRQTVSMDEPPELDQRDLQQELWKPWKDSPYEVSNMGRVRRDQKDGTYMIRRPRSDGKGHLRYNLTWERNGIAYREEPFIHQMVMALFGPPKPAGDHIIILHGGDNGHDNRLSNLSWGSRAENVEEAYDNGKLHRSNY